MLCDEIFAWCTISFCSMLRSLNSLLTLVDNLLSSETRKPSWGAEKGLSSLSVSRCSAIKAIVISSHHPRQDPQTIADKKFPSPEHLAVNFSGSLTGHLTISGAFALWGSGVVAQLKLEQFKLEQFKLEQFKLEQFKLEQLRVQCCGTIEGGVILCLCSQNNQAELGPTT